MKRFDLSSSKSTHSKDSFEQPTKSTKNLCKVCFRSLSNYCCPRCLTPYCTLPCYQKHSQPCLAEFHNALQRDQIRESEAILRLENMYLNSKSLFKGGKTKGNHPASTVDCAHRCQMMQALHRIYNQHNDHDDKFGEDFQIRLGYSTENVHDNSSQFECGGVQDASKKTIMGNYFESWHDDDANDDNAYHYDNDGKGQNLHDDEYSCSISYDDEDLQLFEEAIDMLEQGKDPYEVLNILPKKIRNDFLCMIRDENRVSLLVKSWTPWWIAYSQPKISFVDNACGDSGLDRMKVNEHHSGGQFELLTKVGEPDHTDAEILTKTDEYDQLNGPNKNHSGQANVLTKADEVSNQVSAPEIPRRLASFPRGCLEKSQPTFLVHIAQVVYAYCYVLRRFHGDYHVDLLLSVQTLMAICPVLSKDARYTDMRQALTSSVSRIVKSLLLGFVGGESTDAGLNSGLNNPDTETSTSTKPGGAKDHSNSNNHSDILWSLLDQESNMMAINVLNDVVDVFSLRRASSSASNSNNLENNSSGDSDAVFNIGPGTGVLVALGDVEQMLSASLAEMSSFEKQKQEQERPDVHLLHQAHHHSAVTGTSIGTGTTVRCGGCAPRASATWSLSPETHDLRVRMRRSLRKAEKKTRYMIEWMFRFRMQMELETWVMELENVRQILVMQTQYEECMNNSLRQSSRQEIKRNENVAVAVQQETRSAGYGNTRNKKIMIEEL